MLSSFKKQKTYTNKDELPVTTFGTSAILPLKIRRFPPPLHKGFGVNKVYLKFTRKFYQ